MGVRLSPLPHIAIYPSGLRGLVATQLFIGSNPIIASWKYGSNGKASGCNPDDIMSLEVRILLFPLNASLVLMQNAVLPSQICGFESHSWFKHADMVKSVNTLGLNPSGYNGLAGSSPAISTQIWWNGIHAGFRNQWLRLCWFESNYLYEC